VILFLADKRLKGGAASSKYINISSWFGINYFEDAEDARYFGRLRSDCSGLSLSILFFLVDKIVPDDKKRRGVED